MDDEMSQKRRRVEQCKTVAFDYIRPGMRLTPGGIAYARRANTWKLLRERKLTLILDLDQTLLHTKVVHRSEEKLHLRFAHNRPYTDLFWSDPIWTKLRPFARDFLREASAMFDMYLYTNGCRAYALRMSRLLDPAGEYFASKVIARQDSTVPKRKGLDVVLAEETHVVILDDTPDVWAGHEANLITVPKYTFFGSQTPDESDSDCELKTILCSLQTLHEMFFDPGVDQKTRSVAEVLRIIDGWESVKPSLEAANI